MNDLTNELFAAQSGEALPDGLHKFVHDYVSLTDGLAEFQRVESLCTFLFSKTIYRNLEERSDIQRLRADFLRWLGKRLGDEELRVKADSEDVLRRLLDRSSVEAGNRIEQAETQLVTLNVDLLIERFMTTKLNRDATWTWDYQVDLPRYSRDYSNAVRRGRNWVLPYLKLHGSVNWFRAHGADRNDLQSVFEVQPGTRDSWLHEDDYPVFIPMAHTKENFLHGTLFATLWSTMTAYLDRATEISFIGYGFPETDQTNLLEFLRHKERVRHIVILEAPQHPLETRLSRLFPYSQIRNQDAIEYIQERSIFW
jgi:hypothetical protein